MSAEVQLTDCVRFSVLRSEKTQVAVSCREVPLAIEGFGGVIVIDVSVAAVTVRVVDPEIPS
jgi:hypothetical protein